MPELVINKVEDLAKLVDWKIKAVQFQPGPTPQLIFEITHPAAACPVKLSVTGDIEFGRSGNILVANPVFRLNAADVR